MNVANIIKFGVAFDPSFCLNVSKHVMGIVNTDADIQQYRRTFDDEDRVEQLYSTQLQWYRELTHVRTVTGDTSPPPSLHVTDIYLDGWSDNDTVRLTEEQMSANLGTIVSVYLWSVLPPLHGVTQYLPKCPNLTALFITSMPNTEDHAQIIAVIPRLTQLDTIWYNGLYAAVEDCGAVVAAALRLTQLRCIQLWNVSMGDDDDDDDDDVLVLTADWTRLQTVVLWNVRMSAWAWGRFVSGLFTVRHPVDVTLRETDIDDDTMGRIKTSPHFTMTGRYDRETDFEFTTVPHRRSKKCCIM